MSRVQYLWDGVLPAHLRRPATVWSEYSDMKDEKKHKTKGQVTVPFGVAVATATMIISGIASYFSAQMSTQASINIAKTDLQGDISDDRQRIAKLEEAIGTIKTSNEQTQKDIHQIYLLLK